MAYELKILERKDFKYAIYDNSKEEIIKVFNDKEEAEKHLKKISKKKTGL